MVAGHVSLGVRLELIQLPTARAAAVAPPVNTAINQKSMGLAKAANGPRFTGVERARQAWVQ
jgi:hypothetical protein